MQFHFHSTERIDESMIIFAEDGIEVTSVYKQTQYYMCSGLLDFPKKTNIEPCNSLSIKKIIELRYMKIAEMY